MTIFISNVNERARRSLSQLITEGGALEVDYGIQIFDIDTISEISAPGCIIMSNEFNFVAVSQEDFGGLYIEA